MVVPLTGMRKSEIRKCEREQKGNQEFFSDRVSC